VHSNVISTTIGSIPDSVRSADCLIFCYFNSQAHFKDYSLAFKGSALVLIGPIDGKRHCDPEPKSLTGSNEWLLIDEHDVRGEGEDCIAVYKRINQSSTYAASFVAGLQSAFGRSHESIASHM